MARSLNPMAILGGSKALIIRLAAAEKAGAEKKQRPTEMTERRCAGRKAEKARSKMGRKWMAVGMGVLAMKR